MPLDALGDAVAVFGSDGEALLTNALWRESWGQPGTLAGLAGLGLAVFVNLMAQVWLALARRPRRHAWLPYATSAYDISMTTLVLALLATREPSAALNSIVVWNFYMLSIAVTALRNDGRLALGSGALAILQYGALVLAIWSLSPQERLVSMGYGMATVTGQVERLVLLAMMTLVACAIVYRMQRLVDLSGRDSLTGLPNRAWLLQHMPRVLDAARREGHSLTLALIDLDQFKRINHDIGHAAGDQALRHVAARLEEMLGDDEHLARIGGQEFVMVLRCPIGSAWERLDRMRRAIAQSPYLLERGNEQIGITFSAGLASYPQDGSDASGLLGSADRRLQEAKKIGGNRVVALDP